ncbi:MAG TPA: multifunctional CCA tRNA nucleotidyl transferase/2'3'-cyclic phosphodiesterase/2'nucleotidase/phosphatase [Casimicrobiaceae bacterium]|jgi:tRNA nucleotidyltransferase (CCA-adding enzyme)
MRAERQRFNVYRVGGSVRDELLGRDHGDRDWVVVGATPEMMTASGYKPVGSDFPVFLHPDTREEYALARTERKHGRGYRGFEFFASPEVTLTEDLARRDLTINAMARAENGALIDPYGGADDLRAGILRHVSPAFVEDPLRVLRVARFAARFGFKVARETLALMRKLVASGELETLAPERIWQEIARGLGEPHPARMIAVLRTCGALSQLLPEVGALYDTGAVNAGNRLARALEWSAAHGHSLAARYAVFAYDFAADSDGASVRARVARADAISMRLRVPVDCRDAARLVARWRSGVDRGESLTPADIVDLLQAADALRRPERLTALLHASEAIASSGARRAGVYAPADLLPEAREVVLSVDAGAVARRAKATSGSRGHHDTAIAKAIRAARIDALHKWKERRVKSGTQRRASRRQRVASNT